MPAWTRPNRHRESGAVRLWPMMKLIASFGVIAAGAMLCVWQHTQNAMLARDIDQARSQLQEISDNNHRLALQIAQLELPQVLDAKNRAWQIGLVPPYESQIVRVPAHYQPVPPPRTAAASAAVHTRRAPAQPTFRTQ
jgi:cell division protein FtsB